MLRSHCSSTDHGGQFDDRERADRNVMLLLATLGMLAGESAPHIPLSFLHFVEQPGAVIEDGGGNARRKTGGTICGLIGHRQADAVPFRRRVVGGIG
ncbi:Glutamate synthase [NADPH] small chain [Anopheles sinensis]|uniref:Glutamate synthase [NADPH] small chain n=1 Tax=Anopheles sinensis TaxID=74873 RepID=A0A084VLA1_ANOSI|nr:Glutamate synthase [NADPH] small chain [Anopheles sinensis]